MTSDEDHPLEDVIQKAEFATDWYVILNGEAGPPASNNIDLATTSNSMYITYGLPRFSGTLKNEPTHKRMERAMDYAATDTPDAKDELIARILRRCRAFDLNERVPVQPPFWGVSL